MFPGKRHLLIGLAVCACLHLASICTRRIAPAYADVPFATEGSFERDGQYPGEAFAGAAKVRAWGSWSGSDDNMGSIAIGPFPAPRILRFGISGYPSYEDNFLRVERADGSHSIRIKTEDARESWAVVDFELPAEWKGRPIRIIAHDTAKGVGGWLAITEPIRGGRSDGNNALIQSLAAFAINGLLLGVVYCAAAGQLVPDWSRGAPIAENDQNAARSTSSGLQDSGGARAPHPHPIHGLRDSPGLPPHWIPLAAGAVVALCGYLAFWAYFANALIGVIFSWTVIATATLMIVRQRRERHSDPASAPTRDVTTVLTLMAAIGAFYLGLLHLFPTSHDFYTLAANRYREALPSDNMLPHTTAERLFTSEPLKNPLDEWLSSDRPPLQSGWQLLTWPAGKLLGIDRRTASGTSAMWFQLLWVAAAYGLLRSFAVERTRAAGWIAAMTLAGFFVQNTTYTWPKLSAGALACGMFGLLFLLPSGTSKRTAAIWAALFAALAWLSHGGVGFSFLALVPLLACAGRRGAWRAWGPGAVAALILISPWLAYQTFHDPPANRLVKWHLAGEPGKDSRGTWQTLRENYAKIGWREAWSNKVSNFHAQVFGDWNHLFDYSAATAGDRRHQEFFYPGRALTWWPILALFAIVITRRRIFTPPRDFLLLAGWLLLTIFIWCLLMFGLYQAVVHHGSYAVMIGWFVFFSVVLDRCGRGWLALLTGLQAVTLATTWVLGNPTINGPAAGLIFVVGTGGVVGWFVLRALTERGGVHSVSWGRGASAAFGSDRMSPSVAPRLQPDYAAGASRPQEETSEPALALASRTERISAGFRAWWANPRITFWALAACALVLALRKPHVLHTPQLYAEDGSIFLMQADLHGTSALVMPYMGYLHTLPRLIAWLTPKLFDPAWWPAFYNGVSFLIWLAVLARLFTSRFDLPGKPWLAFALIAVPHSGEVFFNVTNLQWLTAFVLIQQVLILPPKTNAQRVGDLLILAMVTLTGPFGVAFLPLFIWRWWRDRRPDNAAALGVVLLGAAIQVWFVIQTGPRFEYQSQPLRLWNMLEILARRIVVWPAFGTDLAFSMAPALVAAIGVTIALALIAWSLRPHPRRRLRAPIVVALGLITLAAMYRTRPDTWASDNVDYGDRYFYIPRVLVAWLLIWEFDAVPRWIANLARVVCVTVLLLHLRSYTIRAPVNYHWAEHVEPIRKGVRADIPTLPEGWTLDYRGRPSQQP